MDTAYIMWFIIGFSTGFIITVFTSLMVLMKIIKNGLE